MKHSVVMMRRSVVFYKAFTLCFALHVFSLYGADKWKKRRPAGASPIMQAYMSPSLRGKPREWSLHRAHYPFLDHAKFYCVYPRPSCQELFALLHEKRDLFGENFEVIEAYAFYLLSISEKNSHAFCSTLTTWRNSSTVEDLWHEFKRKPFLLYSQHPMVFLEYNLEDGVIPYGPSISFDVHDEEVLEQGTLGCFDPLLCEEYPRVIDGDMDALFPEREAAILVAMQRRASAWLNKDGYREVMIFCLIEEKWYLFEAKSKATDCRGLRLYNQIDASVENKPLIFVAKWLLDNILLVE